MSHCCFGDDFCSECDPERMAAFEKEQRRVCERCGVRWSQHSGTYCFQVQRWRDLESRRDAWRASAKRWRERALRATAQRDEARAMLVEIRAGGRR